MLLNLMSQIKFKLLLNSIRYMNKNFIYESLGGIEFNVTDNKPQWREVGADTWNFFSSFPTIKSLSVVLDPYGGKHARLILDVSNFTKVTVKPIANPMQYMIYHNGNWNNITDNESRTYDLINQNEFGFGIYTYNSGEAEYPLTFEILEFY